LKSNEETKRNWIKVNSQLKRVHEVEESQYTITRTEAVIGAGIILLGVLMILDTLAVIDIRAAIEQLRTWV